MYWVDLQKLSSQMSQAGPSTRQKQKGVRLCRPSLLGLLPGVFMSEQTSLILPAIDAPEGNREIHVLDTDYERYTILKLSVLWQGRNFHVLKYFSKYSLGWGSALQPPSFRLPAQHCGAPQLGALRMRMSQASGGSGK